MQLIFIFLSVVVALVLISVIFVTSAKKIPPTQVLVKTSRFNNQYEVCRCSAFILPVLHSTKLINITPEIIELELMEHQSLACQDGIRIQLKVQFMISVNDNDDGDILLVAKKFDSSFTIENLKTIFLNALTSVTRSLNYEEINGSYKLSELDIEEQNDIEKNKCLSNFKQLVLQELGESSDGKIEENYSTIISGYRINEMSIIKLEMLHNLDSYNSNDISDMKGVTKIEDILSKYEQKRIEIKIHQDKANKNAAIQKDASEKEFQISKQQSQNFNEIKGIELKNEQKTKEAELHLDFMVLENQRTEKEIELETQRIETQSKKAKKESEFKLQEMQLANEQKAKELELEKNISQKKIQHKHELSEFEKEKTQISRLENEAREQIFNSRERERKKVEAEEELELLQQFIERAQQREQLNIAEAKETKAREIEESLGEQTLQNIKAQTEAQTQFSVLEAQTKAEASQLKIMAEARQHAAQHEQIAAEIEAAILQLKGNIEAEVSRAKIMANNEVSQQCINAEIIKLLMPLLPQITASLMAPAEKIDSIKFLNINGLDSFAQTGNADNITNTPFNSIFSTIMTVGMAAPIILNIIKMLKDDENNLALYHDIVDAVKNIPGIEKLLEQLEEDTRE